MSDQNYELLYNNLKEAVKAAKDYLRHMAERYRTDLAPGTWGWRTIAQILDETADDVEKILQIYRDDA